ncbi:hypothetical protein MANES_11G121566v8 [Manihot esculenta]|uniref:Uncharacterized protein n=1 Tax=Manihot esculenta TaxID=3983 RepID=A0ACB7GVF3_MANES|nr:hypothetical protein MANES_11G121566v8 [Manihot esculenta]
MKEGIANPGTSEATSLEAAASKIALIDCGCTAICFGCPYKINWIQIGQGLIGRYCTCTCNCPPNPFFPNPTKPTPSTSQVPSTPSIPQVPGTPTHPTKPTPSIPQVPSTPSILPVPSTPSTPQVPSTPSTPQVPSTPSTPTPSTPQVPSTPSTPQVPTTPSTPQVPRVPFIPPFSSLTCAETSVNLGLCWARASVGTAFHNYQLAAGCCDMFTQWSRGCFGGNDEIPRIVSNFVPPALVQYCANLH